MNLTNEINNYIINHIKVLNELDVEKIQDAFILLWKTFQKGGMIYCIGNGGSASTASHFANDFNKGLKPYTILPFNFVCLSDNIATITAIANDESYEDIYYYQLLHNLQPNDIILAISGSGNSKNIIKAVEYAKKCGNKIIGLTGFDGGRLKELSNISLHIPIDNMQITEDFHLMLNHLLMTLFIKQYSENSTIKS